MGVSRSRGHCGRYLAFLGEEEVVGLRVKAGFAMAVMSFVGRRVRLEPQPSLVVHAQPPSCVSGYQGFTT